MASLGPQDEGWIGRNIRIPVCSAYVADIELAHNGRATCQCGSSMALHTHLAQQNNTHPDDTVWNPDLHTSDEPTDAYGDFICQGLGKSQRKYARVSYKTSADLLYNVLTRIWGLRTPNLVMSVVGGEANFQLKPWVRDVLRTGLMRAVQSTGAWLITGGLLTGVMRHIGEAVSEHSMARTPAEHKVVAIGIVPWGQLAGRKALLNKRGLRKEYTVPGWERPLLPLDKNHSHFLLVDDGSTGQRSTHVHTLRVHLERFIAKQKTMHGGTGCIEIPVLYVLIGGELEVLKTVQDAVVNGTPCLVLGGSGGIADIITAVVSVSPDEITAEMVATHHHAAFPNEDELSGEQLDKWTDVIKSIVEQSNMLTALTEEEHEVAEPMDTVILKSLFKACRGKSHEAAEYKDELNLALAWNQMDIAKSEIFNGNIAWKAKDLEESMHVALVSDKPDFVKLFVENGVNIGAFLTLKRLQQLYRAAAPKSVLHKLLSDKLARRKDEKGGSFLFGKNDDDDDEDSGSNEADAAATVAEDEANGGPLSGSNPDVVRKPGFTMRDVSLVLHDFLGDVCEPIYQGSTEKSSLKTLFKSKVKEVEQAYTDETDSPTFEEDSTRPKMYPYRDLFIWAVLQNRRQMALYFWEMGQNSVASMLAAMRILKGLSRLEVEAEAAREMKDFMVMCENMSVAVLNECYRTSQARTFKLLVRQSPSWGNATCLQLASEANAEAFFSHSAAQDLLNDIWWGDMSNETDIWKIFAVFFCPPLLYCNLIEFSELSIQKPSALEMDSVPDGDNPMLSLLQKLDEKDIEGVTTSMREHYTCSRRWTRFWGAPIIVFLGNVVTYFMFLFLFAYVLLVDFRPPPVGPRGPEIFLYFWVFTLVCEEIRQSFHKVGNISLVHSLKQYIEDFWNKCDIIAISLFILGLILRMFPSRFNDGRVVFCLDYMVFAMRLIHIFAVHKQLGPKIIIVGGMIKDVFFFLFILGIWLIAYGVATEGLLHPDDTRLDWTFRRVLYRPYLQIFGQIPLDEMDAVKILNCTDDSMEGMMGSNAACPNTYANWIVILLLVIFLLVTNVLLLNLLIAMFSYTFSQVQGNSDKIWRFQRYNLIVEYHDRPSLAPPFIIISHIKHLVRKFVFKATAEKHKHFMQSLQEDVDQRLMVWEGIQKVNYLTDTILRKRDCSEERLKRTSKKLDMVLKLAQDIQVQERRLNSLDAQYEQMRYCAKALSWLIEAQKETNKDLTMVPPVCPGLDLKRA
ncbi:transient receptor potential cation channel subfamily M member 5 isoform X1 [Lampetra planeri]